MDLWNRTFLRFTLIEWLIAVIVLLVLARFIWGRELLALEDGFFASIGLGGGAKYLVTVPLGAWVLYQLFRREKAEASARGMPVVRTQVLVIAAGLLVLAIGLLFMSVQ
jgi:hypothetical protein